MISRSRVDQRVDGDDDDDDGGGKKFTSGLGIGSDGVTDERRPAEYVARETHSQDESGKKESDREQARVRLWTR